MKRKRTLAKWTPFARAYYTAEQDAALRAMHNGVPSLCFRNSRYQVDARIMNHPVFGRICELSIKTLDKLAHHDWRDFQRIKNEICGDECDAIEIYPKESRLVDTANQYYLYVFRDWNIPLGFESRLVSAGDGELRPNGSRQRPFDDDNCPPDLTTSAEIDAMVRAQIERAQQEQTI